MTSEVSGQCPDGCSCQDTTVNCTGAGLTTIPDDIPITVVNLILSQNSIETIGE